MAQTKQKHTFRNIVLGLLAAGLVLAIMRAFSWNPFGVIEWLCSCVAHIVNHIANFFSGNDTFKATVEGPR